MVVFDTLSGKQDAQHAGIDTPRARLIRQETACAPVCRARTFTEVPLAAVCSAASSSSIPAAVRSSVMTPSSNLSYLLRPPVHVQDDTKPVGRYTRLQANPNQHGGSDGRIEFSTIAALPADEPRRVQCERPSLHTLCSDKINLRCESDLKASVRDTISPRGFDGQDTNSKPGQIPPPHRLGQNQTASRTRKGAGVGGI